MMCLLEMVCAIVVVVFVVRRDGFHSRRVFRNCMRGYLKGITSVHSEWSVEE